jgi:hypothetical protein
MLNEIELVLLIFHFSINDEGVLDDYNRGKAPVKLWLRLLFFNKVIWVRGLFFYTS